MRVLGGGNGESIYDFFGLLYLHTASNDGFWFLVCNAATQLVTQLPQRRIQVVRSNKVARKRLTESNGTPPMYLVHMNVVWKWYYFNVLFYDCCLEIDIRIRRYTNKQWIKQNTHEQ